jgi:hypothetical protein
MSPNRSTALDPKASVALFRSSDRSNFENGRSPIMSRNESPATAVVRGWELPTGTRSQLNGCIRRLRTGAADQLCEFDASTASVSSVRFSGPSLDDCRRQDSTTCGSTCLCRQAVIQTSRSGSGNRQYDRRCIRRPPCYSRGGSAHMPLMPDPLRKLLHRTQQPKRVVSRRIIWTASIVVMQYGSVLRGKTVAR